MRRGGITAETWFMLACVALAALASLFLGSLVAEPKLLFGRALTAIPPTLFPRIVLALLLLLSVVLLAGHVIRATPKAAAAAAGQTGWRRGVVFFGIMTLYALTMVPFGFLISSAIATSLLSWQMGNRTLWQIGLLSLGGPVLLYLAATRLLAVSLPELNVIELFYAGLLAGGA